MNKLVAFVAHAIMFTHQMVGWIVVIMVVKVFSPVLHICAVEQWSQTTATHLYGLFHPSKVKKGGRKVDVLHQLIAFRSLFYVPGIADNKWRVERFFVHEPLIKPSVFAHIEALVRRVHHNGVVAKSVLFQIVKQSAHVVVNRTYHGNIVAYVVLILPLHQFLARKLSFDKLLVPWHIVFVEGNALFGSKSACFSEQGVIRIHAFNIAGVERFGHFQVLNHTHIVVDTHLLRACS